jgi:uncharacterized protein (DUF433 family)
MVNVRWKLSDLDLATMTDEHRFLIARDPQVCHGQATVRGTRILVSIILEALADGMTEAEILADYPTLTVDGIRAAAAYGAELARDEYPAVASARITIDHRIMGGLPCIAGTRIPVAMLVRMIEDGIPVETILEEYPQLEVEDVREALRLSPKRNEQLLKAESLVEDIGLADLAAHRDDGRFHEGATTDFLAEVEEAPEVAPPPPRQPDESLKGHIERGNTSHPARDQGSERTR